ncbi:MAG TPA: TrmH family RNA methyltransferase [Patescibacteria group bacterium]|nr:TrmH family RNA methyltransferase [Patescibacteria group bacterium]
MIKSTPKLNSRQLRHSHPLPKAIKKIKRQEIYFILDNVLDTYNIGSIFRVADAVSAKKIFLCGETERPPNHKIKKASVNTWQWVKWEYQKTAVEAIKSLKKSVPKINIIAIEQTPKSLDFQKAKYNLPLALVVGHETNGVSQAALDLADVNVELPMLGINQSLNVMVSLAIVAYEIIKIKSTKLQVPNKY